MDALFLEFQEALAGRYSIDRELGRGGMGVVYLAREVHLDRPVAIKLLPPARASEAGLRARFLREARLAAKLSHPNIIPIHAVEERDGFVFFVMAFVDGETLAERVRRRGPLPGTEATRVFREVAWALAYAHGQGIVHRDIKPDNILLEAATGRALVADFGIAAAAGDAAGEGVAGTPEFMSPEQALGGAVDARSDLYALGATAWFACTGRLLFEGGTATEVLARQVTEPAPPLAASGAAVPRKFSALVDRCLAKEPDGRPASASDLADQIGVALEQRRELPAALRAFVKRYGRLDGSGTVVALFGLFIGSNLASALLGPMAGFGVFVAGLTVGPFAYLVQAARRLTRLGFAHADVAPAFHAELERAREELSVERQSAPSRLERILGGVAKVAGGVWLTSAIAFFVGPVYGRVFALANALSIALALSGFIGIGTLIGWMALRQRRTDVDTEFWAKVWAGKLGKAAFALGRRMVGHHAPASAMTHRATELAVGLAAEELYESLPAATRKELGDLPAVLTRLQQDAQGLRRHYTMLQEALADLGEAAAKPEHAELRATRDAIHARLGDVVGALETVRLNLLRLHAGSATVAGLTTHLALAAEVSAEVERLVAAREETERLLRPGR